MTAPFRGAGVWTFCGSRREGARVSRVLQAPFPLRVRARKRPASAGLFPWCRTSRLLVAVGPDLGPGRAADQDVAFDLRRPTRERERRPGLAAQAGVIAVRQAAADRAVRGTLAQEDAGRGVVPHRVAGEAH